MGRPACSHGQQQAGSLEEEGLPVLEGCPSQSQKPSHNPGAGNITCGQ